MQSGMHFAVSEQVAAELVAAAGDDARLAELVRTIEEDRLYLSAAETDKAWDPILCALSPDGYERIEESWPACGVVLGERVLNADADAGIISYLCPDGVRTVADYLAALTEQQFTDCYAVMPADARNPEYGEQECEYAWAWLCGVREFFATAADCERHVLFTVDF